MSLDGISVVDTHWITPHNSNPRPANAAALLKQELAATSAAGAFDADSSGSDATAFLIAGEAKTKGL